jgi:pimeloyl-ACP methyl ester carboxylesterase
MNLPHALLGVLLAGTTLLPGTPTAPPTRFHDQPLEWAKCGDPILDHVGGLCAQVTVPLDYSKPQGKTIEIAISRIKATDPGKRRGVILSNPGGPGGSGLSFMGYISQRMTPEVTSQYDLIGMDPRGVGRSAPVDCGWPIGHMLWSAGPNRETFRRAVKTQSDLARRCVRREGDRIAHITTRNTARDMDVIRAALGESKISYFGMSYGTYLGAVYTQMFPQRSDRFVLDSAIDPAQYMAGSIRNSGAANEAGLDDWAAWTAKHHREYRLGTTARQVRARVESLIKAPIRVGEHLVDERFLPMVVFNLLTDARHNARLAARVRLLADAAEGKPVRPSEDLEQELQFTLYGKPQGYASQAAVICGDAGVSRDPGKYWRDIQRSRATQPVFGPYANNITACAFWPTPREPATRVGNDVPALIVQATGDTRTVYREGVNLRRAMSASRLVTVKDVRMHGVFGNLPNTCVEKAVNTYFAHGTLPADDLTCRPDPS